MYRLHNDNLFPPAEIEAQRRVRQMRVIILRPWSNYSAFVVIVVLITHIPIKPVMQLDGQSGFRRLITHWIRCDQGSGIARRICHSISLAVVFIDSIGSEERRSWSNSRHRFYKEEIVPYDVEAVAKRMLHAVEEVVDDRFAVYPMVVVAGADREPRGRGPIK